MKEKHRCLTCGHIFEYPIWGVYYDAFCPNCSSLLTEEPGSETIFVPDENESQEKSD